MWAHGAWRNDSRSPFPTISLGIADLARCDKASVPSYDGASAMYDDGYGDPAQRGLRPHCQIAKHANDTIDDLAASVRTSDGASSCARGSGPVRALYCVRCETFLATV